MGQVHLDGANASSEWRGIDSAEVSDGVQAYVIVGSLGSAPEGNGSFHHDLRDAASTNNDPGRCTDH